MDCWWLGAHYGKHTNPTFRFFPPAPPLLVTTLHTNRRRQKYLTHYTWNSFNVYVPAWEMRSRELLTGFVSFLPVGRSTHTKACSSYSRIAPSGLGRSVSGECRMGVPVEGTPTFKSAKRVFDTQKCTIINDIPRYWNMRYLYYFNGLILLD